MFTRRGLLRLQLNQYRTFQLQALEHVSILRTALFFVILTLIRDIFQKRVEVSLNSAQANRLWIRLKLFSPRRANASAQPASASGAVNFASIST